MKKNNKKGFTLAELLIVVAIIAVLAAVAIPVFTNQLTEAKKATQLANARSTYAEAVTNYLLNNSATSHTATYGGITYTATTTNGSDWTVTLSGTGVIDDTLNFPQ